MTDYLIKVYQLGGKIGAFRKAAKDLGINTDYYALQTYDYDKQLPWDFIEITPQKEFFKEECQKLLNQTK